MGKGKWTQGPWKLSFQGIKPFVHIGNKVFSVNPSWSTDAEDEANARLIAAAPELLKICKKLLQDFDDKVYICGEEDEINHFKHLKELREAISKAEETNQ